MSESHKLADFDPVPITPLFKPNDYGPTLPQPWPERSSQRNRMILTDLTVDIPESHRVPKDAPEMKPKARWKSLEFKIYYAVACVMIPAMAWVPISLSLESHPNYKLFERRLSPGWIPYRKVDNSDAQYRGFRNNFWLLTGLASVYLFVKYIWTRLGTSTPPDNTYLFRFKLVCSVLFLFGLHGTSLLKILIILAMNYAIARLCGGSKAGPLLTTGFKAHTPGGTSSSTSPCYDSSPSTWIIGSLRYIYIPLGGAKRVLLNTLLVFTFVALWHDLTFKLLAWGWLVSLFVVPEVLATYLLPASKVRVLIFTSLATLFAPVSVPV
ncbi:hypothetical protein C0991_007339 [Blastosporella zonata]|nr:hypothetical protein C0991_007339 [Blastosporella zonata]